MAFFGQNLKKVRRQRGMTQEDLAKALGVTTRTIQNYECFVALPSRLDHEKLEKVLNVPIGVLVCDDDDRVDRWLMEESGITLDLIEKKFGKHIRVEIEKYIEAKVKEEVTKTIYRIIEGMGS